MERKNKIFSNNSAYLFEKSVAIDLIKEFASKRESISMKTYLNVLKDSLISPLKGALSKEELDSLHQLIDSKVFGEKILEGLEATISVHTGFSENKQGVPVHNQHRETVTVHSSQQERVEQKLKVTAQDNLNEFLQEVESRKQNDKDSKSEIRFKPDDFEDRTFGWNKKDIDVTCTQPCLWSLSDALTHEKLENPGCQFHQNLSITSNAAVARKGTIDLIGPFRKKPWTFLVIGKQREGQTTWQLVLCSIQDTVDFRNWISPGEEKLHLENSMWLMRGNGKLLAGPGQLDIDQNDQLALLATQAVFFSGDYETLSYNPWKTRLEKWFGSLSADLRSKWIAFFEEDILIGIPPEYKSSPLYEFFHNVSTPKSLL